MAARACDVHVQRACACACGMYFVLYVHVHVRAVYVGMCMQAFDSILLKLWHSCYDTLEDALRGCATYILVLLITILLLDHDACGLLSPDSMQSRRRRRQA